MRRLSLFAGAGPLFANPLFAKRVPAGVRVLLSLWALAGTAAAGDPLAGLPDPTRPSAPDGPARTGPQEEEPLLQSTLISPSRRLAVIGGRPYRVGDRLDGARVVAIRPYEVELDGTGGRRLLRLAPLLPRSEAGGDR